MPATGTIAQRARRLPDTFHINWVNVTANRMRPAKHHRKVIIHFTHEATDMDAHATAEFFRGYLPASRADIDATRSDRTGRHKVTINVGDVGR